MTGIALITILIIFSCLSVNLTTHLGIGLDILASSKRNEIKKHLIKLSILFPVIILLWLLITLLRSIFSLGFLEYILLFPVCYSISFAIESYLSKFNFYISTESTEYNSINTNASIITAILFIILNVSGNFLQAMTLIFGFLLGLFTIIVVIIEIKSRAELEKTPQLLKGSPIMLIAVGLLSIIFSSAAIMLMRIMR